MCNTWRRLNVCRADLQLKPTLCGGQSFRWKNPKTDYWIGTFKNLVWILIQYDNYISYKCAGTTIDKKDDVKVASGNLPENNCDSTDELLSSYLRLNVDLKYYYKIWCEADPYFCKAAPKMFGVRILNQDVTENIFSFICSSNNNIKRITSMVEKLCIYYGKFIREVDGEKYYSFPETNVLAQPTVESDLRKAGFGYRAKFIYQTACVIEKLGGHLWIQNLKMLPYLEAKKELMKLSGVGAKVADCICLMSLGHMEAVPVDTHIFKVAGDVYLPHIKKYKSLNAKIYNEVSDHFRLLHGSYAGWANTILFCSDLKQLQASNKDKEILKENIKIS